MKKYGWKLLTALCVCVMMSMMAVQVEADECMHEYLSVSRYVEENGRTYREIDNQYHFTVGLVHKETWCKTCDELVSDELISGQEGLVELHEYVNGTCTICGHVNTCPHGTGWSEDFSVVQTVSYEQFNTYMHNVYETSKRGTRYYCLDCNETTSVEIKPEYESFSYLQHHTYVGGVCKLCGQYNTCLHNRYTEKSTYIDESTALIEAVNNKFHKISGKLYEEVYCNSCHSAASVTLLSENESRVYWHDYAGGSVCIECGYVNACTHPNVEIVQYIYPGEWFDIREYQVIDSKHHMESGILYERAWCEDCSSEVYNKMIAESGSLVKLHFYQDDWDDGRVCVGCGYVADCSHDNIKRTEIVIFDSPVDEASAVYQQIGDEYHLLFGPLYEELECDDCGAYRGCEFIDPNGSIKQKHCMSDGVKCDHCGYVKISVPQSGWELENGKWYFYENGEKVVSSWRKDSTGWVYLGSDGAMLTNAWVQDSVGWCYVGADGYAVTNCWKQDSVGWCYLNGEGSMTKNAWVETDGKWYYLNENGYRVTNAWRKDSKGWVWLGSDGAMLTNAWVADSKGWCYVGSDGYAVTNCWKQDSIGWCYLDSEGSMVRNAWVTTDGKTYRLSGDGYRMENTWVQVDGKWYWLGSDGAMATNMWQKDSVGWVYVGSDGAMVTNAWTKDSVGWCYMGSDGYAVTNCWKHDGTGWRYLDSNGSMMKNAWLLDGGSWYWLNGDGYMVTGTVVIDGVEHRFADNGVWLG